MFTYAKCSGSPWLLQIPAEDDKGKGKHEVGNGNGEVIYWPSLFDERDNQCCFISFKFLPALVEVLYILNYS